MNLRLLILIITCFTLFTRTYGEGGSGIDMLIFSVSTWGTTNSTLGGGDTKDSYFHSFKADVYYHLGWMKGYVGFPLTLTLEYPENSNDVYYAFYPIDFSFYVGKSFGNLEPRVGMDIPMGYPTSNEKAKAWTGSKNYNLILGLGFNGGEHFNKRLSIGGEIMGRLYLNSLEQSALIENGSYKVYLAAKATVKLSKKWSSGLELFTEYKWYRNTDWTRIYPDPEFNSYGILPILFAGFQPTPKTEIALKAGLGREINNDFTGRSYSTIIFGALGFNVYLW